MEGRFSCFAHKRQNSVPCHPKISFCRTLVQLLLGFCFFLQSCLTPKNALQIQNNPNPCSPPINQQPIQINKKLSIMLVPLLLLLLRWSPHLGRYHSKVRKIEPPLHTPHARQKRQGRQRLESVYQTEHGGHPIQPLVPCE